MADLKRTLFLHVMPKEKFTYGFIEFTFASFPDVDVRFVVYGDDGAQGYESYVDERVIPVSSTKAVFKDEMSRQLLHDADAVILNWVNMSMLPSMWRYLPKTHLLFWGGDFSPYVSEEWQGSAHWLKRQLLAACIRRARGIIGIVQSDLGKIASVGKYVKTQYVCELGDLPSRYDEGITGECERSITPLKILLGNSATPTNRHKAALRLLSRFANEDICIYAPLSYGDDAYRDEIIAYGNKLFGNKFIPLTGFMDRVEYAAFLSQISIGVFNYDRQQGLGNIHLLMRMGAKVFISRDSSMLADHIANGAIVECLEDIDSLSFDDFRAPLDEKEIACNRDLYSGNSFFERAKNHWDTFYGNYGKAGIGV